MKPLPFPLALNIGTDIVHIPRITRLLQQTNYLGRFTRRILSDQEHIDFRKRFQHISQPQTPSHASSTQPTITPEMTRWLAGRFAAKEAARKAAPGGAAALSWKDVVIRVPELGDEAEGERVDAGVDGSTSRQQRQQQQDDGTSRRPEIVFLGDGMDQPDRLGQLSISHDGDYVVATVLAAG
ncbi:4'-phosphopantetheinyl transferase B [Penicillium diatomitis]|uniref:4'-phosphopantetheinyl transferase B n=1 Tax=Penicillium diatomitis TaxID=2819901 RepID=A0A9W9X1S9_9EURO|nr:4'-phosphopantetheinyl transferase B [Penicillium diatomitis]KAJ5480879.1 4'-phosphopantetheinyl transferase B [Penicillium diatomitis]